MRLSPELFRQRIEAVRTEYLHCRLCSRRCGVDRTVGPAGVCQLGTSALCYKEFIHYGEEEHLVPSHTVYLSGCSFRCIFCSDDAHVRKPSLGTELSANQLAWLIQKRRLEGARNVNFVGGTPDVHLLAILEALALCPSDTTVVWNSNLYMSVDSLEYLRGIVDVWLIDLKFGNNQCGRLSGVTDYLSVLRPALQYCATDPGSELTVRHLLMPGHFDCCTVPSLDWAARHLADATINLMTTYIPFAKAQKHPVLGRRATALEVEIATSYFLSLPFQRPMVNGRFVRQPSSRTTKTEHVILPETATGQAPRPDPNRRG